MRILNGIGHVAGLRPRPPRDDFWEAAGAPDCAPRTLARTPLASGINENITLNMQYLRSICGKPGLGSHGRRQALFGGPTEDPANDSGTAAPKPAEGAAAAKRPDQMFVVQKSGPVPAAPPRPGQPGPAGPGAGRRRKERIPKRDHARRRRGAAGAQPGQQPPVRHRPPPANLVSPARQPINQALRPPVSRRACRPVRSRQGFSRRGLRPARRFPRRWPKPACPNWPKLRSGPIRCCPASSS